MCTTTVQHLKEQAPADSLSIEIESQVPQEVTPPLAVMCQCSYPALPDVREFLPACHMQGNKLVNRLVQAIRAVTGLGVPCMCAQYSESLKEKLAA